MSSQRQQQQASWNPWHVDVFRSLARFNLPKQLPRRPSLTPRTWAFLPRQWPPNIIPGLGLNLLHQQHHSSFSPAGQGAPRYSRSSSTASYDSCISAVVSGRPSFDQTANYGGGQQPDSDISSCSSSSYSKSLIQIATYRFPIKKLDDTTSSLRSNLFALSLSKHRVDIKGNP